MLEKLHDECTIIFDNSLYTADAHYISAKHYQRIGYWLQSIPAAASAGMGALALSGALATHQNCVIFFATVFAAVSAAISEHEHARRGVVSAS